MYSDGNSYEEILTRALRNPLLSSYDKREGSVIYNALAPLCLELANLYIKMDIMDEQSYLTKSIGANLDLRVGDYGLTREQATYSKRKVIFKDKDGNDVTVPVGSRFSLPSDNSLIYEYIGEVMIDDVATKVVQCLTAGTIGNRYIGAILPLQYISNLAKAEIVDDPYIPADDTETDEELRERAIKFITNVGYGGNIQDYINYVTAIEGVGACKVYPVYKGGGTVLVSIVDSDRRAVSPEFISTVQSKVDPVAGKGYGIAPIGHYVTINTPREVGVRISFNLKLSPNVGGLENVKDSIIDNILAYFKEVRYTYGQDTPYFSVTRARISYAVMAVSGVDNITDIKIDNQSVDMTYADEVSKDSGGNVITITPLIPITKEEYITINVI